MAKRTFGRPVAAIIPTLFGSTLLLSSAGSALAAEPPAQYTLDVVYCTVTDAEGNFLENNVVPAGSEIMLFEGWLAMTRGQVRAFVNNVSWILEANGQPIDVVPALSGLIPFGPYWADVFAVSAGTLASGETLETHYDNVLKSASFDGFIHWAKGSVYNGGVDCSVTAG